VLTGMERRLEEIEQVGYTVLTEVYTPAECAGFAIALQQALNDCEDESTTLRRANGVVYGARNLLKAFPPARQMWVRGPIIELLTAALGPNFGLVRGLFFDKPPEGNWSLPWHQDLTIAVKDHSLPSERFRNRTTKAGVAHVEAPRDLLERMLTLRIHLDDVDDENGPLQVLPGSHRAEGASPQHLPTPIHASAGDVLAIRPLVSHASGPSNPETKRHRRIIHLEFAGTPGLPDGYQWQHYFSPSPDCQQSDSRSN
jgi:hypothetical protein